MKLTIDFLLICYRNHRAQYVALDRVSTGTRADDLLVGGRIEVASEHGKGSTFRFFIQSRTAQTQRRIHNREGSGQRPPLKKRHTGKETTPAAVGPRPHVLIVEDNLINQTVLNRQLKHVGLTTAGKLNVR